MCLKIHNVSSMSEPWLRLNGCEITTPEAADFIVYEQRGDSGLKRTITQLKHKYPTNKLVFINVADMRLVDDKHIWFVQNCTTITDSIHQIYIHNPRIWSYIQEEHVAKDMTGHFAGRLWGIPARQSLLKTSARWEITERTGEFVKLKDRATISTDTYKKMRRSVYTLCPRGMGPSSMRVVEALACSSVPILIDDNTNPYGDNFGDLVIRLKASDVANLDQIIDDLPTPDAAVFQACRDYYVHNICPDLLRDPELPWAVAAGCSHRIVRILEDILLSRRGRIAAIAADCKSVPSVSEVRVLPRHHNVSYMVH